MNPPNRRDFLLLTGTFILVGCSNESKDLSGSLATTTTPGGGWAVAQRFSQDSLVPGRVRLPISLADDQQVLSDGPDSLTATLFDTNTARAVVSDVTAKKRRVSEGYVYWDFHMQIDEPGTYALVIDGGDPAGGGVQVLTAELVSVPSPGEQLPPFETPTTADGRGVDPICTRLEGGPCPFHDITLTEALTKGTPVAYLIGTPAHCQFGTCAPGLEFLITAAKRFGDKLTVVHAEVYTDDTATVAAPAVQALNLSFEPTLILADASGKVVTRLDAAWDQSELDETLEALVNGAS